MIAPAKIAKPAAPTKTPDPWSKTTRKKMARAAKESAKLRQEAHDDEADDYDWMQQEWDDWQAGQAAVDEYESVGWI